MSILGYIVYALSILYTLGYCETIRTKVKNTQSTEKAQELQGFLMTLSLILVPILSISPFHLLWMIPVSFILGLLSITFPPLRILLPFSSIYFSLWYIGIHNLGRQYYIDGQYDKAIDAFQKQIIKNPKSADAYFNLGLVYGKMGQQDNEIEAYEEAIKLNPRESLFYFNLGIVYYDLKKTNKAIDAFQEAIRLKPNYLKPHYNICKIYFEKGDQMNGHKHLEIVNNLDSSAANDLRSKFSIR